MHLITSLLTKLRIDFPQFKFIPSDRFKWSPAENTISYDTTSEDVSSLLHEISHALLGHHSYTKDVQLIEMERDAWQYTHNTLGPLYSVRIDEDIRQDSMDTYRDWLHARSTCPNCQAIGLQTKQDSYKCIACNELWKVNNSRLCALRRYSLTK